MKASSSAIVFAVLWFLPFAGCAPVPTAAPTAFPAVSAEPRSTPTPDSNERLSIPVLTLDEEWSSFAAGAVRAIAIAQEPVADGTGAPPVAILTADRSLSLLHVRGGRYAEAFTAAQGSGEWDGLVLDDLDGDGDNEVVVGVGELRIYERTGETYALAWSGPDILYSTDRGRLLAADVDGEEGDELVALNVNTGGEMQSLYIYKRTDAGLGSWTESYSYAFPGGTGGYQYTSGLAVADFNDDGVKEIVVGSDNGVLWAVQRTGEGFRVGDPWKVPEGGAVGPGLAAGDVNGDGGQELLVGTNGGKIYVYGFDGSMMPYIMAQAAAGRLAYGVASADADSDGRDEFLVGRGVNDYAGMTWDDVVLELWKLESDGLHRVWSAKTVNAPWTILPYDLDRNGRMEYVVLGRYGELDVLQ